MLVGWPYVAAAPIPAALARLADQSLLVAAADPARNPLTRAGDRPPVRYRFQLDAAGGADQACARHPSWCLDAAAALGTRPEADRRGGRRSISWPTSCAPLRWAAARAGRQPEAYRLAMTLADLAFARGLPG
jgi:hypothetical protein